MSESRRISIVSDGPLRIIQQHWVPDVDTGDGFTPGHWVRDSVDVHDGTAGFELAPGESIAFDNVE